MQNLTLAGLAAMFPVRQTGHRNVASTGYIPMSFFKENQALIKHLKKEHKLRTFFRGPREFHASGTLKDNATHAVLYRK